MEKEYLVLNVSCGVARNGSPFCTLKLMDGKEQITATAFDYPKEFAPNENDVLVMDPNAITVSGKYKNIDKTKIYRRFPCPDEHPLSRFIPKKISQDSWNEVIANLLCRCSDPLLMDVIEEGRKQLYELYCDRPAATVVHHAYAGGLLKHTYEMLRMLEAIYPVLPRPEDVKIEYVVIACMYHDYGKLFEYDEDKECTDEMFLLGHPFMSSHYLFNLLRTKQVPMPAIERIVHCTLAHHGKLEFGSPVVPATSEAFLVSTLDALSGHGTIYADTFVTEKSKNYFVETRIIKGYDGPVTTEENL